MRDVIDTMKRHGISQLPVLENGKLRGIVPRSTCSATWSAGSGHARHAHRRPHRERLRDGHAATKIELLKTSSTTRRWSSSLDRDELVGVITKIDLIDFLAKRPVKA